MKIATNNNEVKFYSEKGNLILECTTTDIAPNFIKNGKVEFDESKFDDSDIQCIDYNAQMYEGIVQYENYSKLIHLCFYEDTIPCEGFEECIIQFMLSSKYVKKQDRFQIA